MKTNTVAYIKEYFTYISADGHFRIKQIKKKIQEKNGIWVLIYIMKGYPANQHEFSAN